MTGPTVTLSNPGGVRPPAGWYHHLARVEGARLLFLAGQVGLDQDGRLAGNGDVHAQLHQAFRNIGKVLESAGASFDSTSCNSLPTSWDASQSSLISTPAPSFSLRYT